MAEILEFERGYKDATNKDEQYFWIQFDMKTFELTNESDTPFAEDMPDLYRIDKNSMAALFDVVEAFEAKGWEHLQ